MPRKKDTKEWHDNSSRSDESREAEAVGILKDFIGGSMHEMLDTIKLSEQLLIPDVQCNHFDMVWAQFEKMSASFRDRWRIHWYKPDT